MEARVSKSSQWRHGGGPRLSPPLEPSPSPSGPLFFAAAGGAAKEDGGLCAKGEAATIAALGFFFFLSIGRGPQGI